MQQKWFALGELSYAACSTFNAAFKKRDHPVRLIREFQLDLMWWHYFLSDWHGISFWLFQVWSQRQMSRCHLMQLDRLVMEPI